MMYPRYSSKTHLLKQYAEDTSPDMYSRDNSRDIEDPIGKDISAYRDVYRQLKIALERILTAWSGDRHS